MGQAGVEHGVTMLSNAILYQRIEKIISLIPDDFGNKEIIVKSLKGIQDSLPFTAPGAINTRWFQVSGVLEVNLPDPDTAPWAMEIAKIFAEDFEE
ncbi:MAG: hypothetical protein WC095_02620 [Candidatus Paceibacterota bacterium]